MFAKYEIQFFVDRLIIIRKNILIEKTGMSVGILNTGRQN